MKLIFLNKENLIFRLTRMASPERDRYDSDYEGARRPDRQVDSKYVYTS